MRIEVRDGEKGPLVAHVAVTRVLAITERKHRESEEVLVITRRVEDDGRIVHDYWLSNAAPETPPSEFVRAAKSRGRIEQCLQRAKSETGLADYETRTWQGWHHHQTLSLLASWFLVLERLRGEKKDADHNGLTTPHRPCDPAVRRHRTARPGTHRPRDTNATRPQRIRQILSLEKTQTPTTFASTAAEMK